MPLFQLENGVMSSCDNRNKADEFRNLNKNSTVATRLSSCNNKNVTNENLHLSSALSEHNFNKKKQSTTKPFGTNQRNSISQDSSNQNTIVRGNSPKARTKRNDSSLPKKFLEPSSTDMIVKNQRLFSGNSKTRQSGRSKHTSGSLSIGPQPHINRLKRFFCDNLDKQNVELAGKIQFMPSNFSSHLKSLISDRMNSAKQSEATGFFQQNLEPSRV